MLSYAILFISSLLLCVLIVPRVIKKAVKLDVVDKPTTRKVHRKTIPLWGGVAIFLSFVLALLLFYLFSSDFFPFSLFAGTDLSRFSMNFRARLGLSSGVLWMKLAGLLLGGTTVVITGMIDDRYGLSPKRKLLGQLIAALIVVSFGGRVLGFNIPFMNHYVSLTSGQGLVGAAIFVFSVTVSVVWILAVINSMNFIDGLDGLAGGISFISAATFFALAFFKPSMSLAGENISAFIAVVSAVLCGSVLGFLFFNFKPAKIFMGDAGSMFLGFMLASLSLLGSFKGVTAITLLTPALILSVPIFDIIFAVARRLSRGVPVSVADKSHVHHRMLALGLSPLQVVVIIWLVAALFNIIAFLLA